MTIFIITANYNSGTDLVATWESLKNQSYRDFKWLIKDNHSSDGSLELALSIQQSDNRVSVIICPDTGIYDGLNQLIDLIDTDSYYLTLGASDTLYTLSLDLISQLCQANPLVDLFFFGLYVGNRKILPMKNFGFLLGLRGCGSSHSVGTVIKSSLHQLHGKYDASYTLLADQLFIKTCLLRNTSSLRSSTIIGNYTLGGKSDLHRRKYRSEFRKVQFATEKVPFLQHILFLLRDIVRPL
jgi:glycosyltransferase involved in cell wall biosynthesis